MRQGPPGAVQGGGESQPLRKALPGTLGLFLFLLLAAAPLGAALLEASREGDLQEALGRVLGSASTARALSFSLSQALASALLALLVGLPGAWLVARHEFPGRALLKALSAIPFCVPPILVVLAFVLYYGRAGLLNRGLMAAFGLAEPPLTFLYSFWGLVLVHGFYNFPIVLQGVAATWEGLPRDREEAARTLGAGPVQAFLRGTLPSLIPAILQAATLVFLFCFFSFVVVLVFGPLGGTTLEVEIYRAARFDADPGSASALALVETGVALVIVLIISFLGPLVQPGLRKTGALQERTRPQGRTRLVLGTYAVFLLVFFAAPLLALVAQAFMVHAGRGGGFRPGLGNFAWLLGEAGRGPLLGSLVDSLSAALPAASLSLFLGIVLALFLKGRKAARLGEAFLSLPLAVSGVVTALGWTLLLPGGGRPGLILVLALSALPFTQRSVSGALAALDRSPALAARTLGAGPLRAALGIELRGILPAILQAGAFAFSIAAGDANAALVMGIDDYEPLPLLIYRLVGAYRFPEACAAGLILAALTGIVFFAKDRKDA